MPTRKEVYEAFDTERAYQEMLWGKTASSSQPGDGTRTLDEWALYISGYATELVQLASHSDNPIEKLNFIRKIGGMCVAAMENHGAPPRQI